MRLTPGGLSSCRGNRTGGTARFHNARQESAEGIVGGREGAEGLNGVERSVGTGPYG